MECPKAGDKVVYPGHGVGEVVGFEKRTFSGIEQSFVIIEMAQNGMKVMVPVNGTRAVGLRSVITKADTEKVTAVMKEPATPGGRETWNRRHREYQEMLKTGSIFDAARIWRNLAHANTVKELSFSERRLYDRARNLVADEVACAKNCPPEDVVSELSALLPKRTLTAA